MKKTAYKWTFTVIGYCLCLFFANNATAQITSSGGQVYLRDGDISSYTNPYVYVSPQYNPFTETWVVTCTVAPIVVPAAGREIIEFRVTLTKAALDAYTGTGSSDTEYLVDAVEQAVIDYLEAITANSGITFTN